MLTDVLAYVWVWVILELLRNSKKEGVKTQNTSSENEKLFGAGVVEAKSNCKKFSEKSRNNPPVENNFKNFQTNQSPPNKQSDNLFMIKDRVSNCQTIYQIVQLFKKIKNGY